MAQDVLVGGESEARAMVDALRAEGWESLPCDDPTKALRGLIVFHYLAEGRPLRRTPKGFEYIDDGGPVDMDTSSVSEEAYQIQWPMFGKGPLETDEIVVKAPEMVELIEKNGTTNVRMCDDPRRLLLGFVWYRPEEGKALVRRIRLTHLKEDRPRMDVIMGFRDKLRALTDFPVGD